MGSGEGMVHCRGCGKDVHHSAHMCPHCGCVQPSQATPAYGQNAAGGQAPAGMSFVEAVKTGFRKYATFEGRASRQEYWYFFLFNILLAVAVPMLQLYGLQGLISLALLVPSIAVAARRLHDSDRSGWNLLWNLTGIGALYVLYLLCLQGTAGPNRHGPEPVA